MAPNDGGGFQLRRSRTTSFVLLDWRTWHRPIRAEHATIAGLRLKPLATSLAVIEELASVGWHLLSRLVPALRTSDCGNCDHGTYKPKTIAKYQLLKMMDSSLWTPNMALHQSWRLGKTRDGSRSKSSAPSYIRPATGIIQRWTAETSKAASTPNKQAISAEATISRGK
jgi:hypothetical protein